MADSLLHHHGAPLVSSSQPQKRPHLQDLDCRRRLLGRHRGRTPHGDDICVVRLERNRGKPGNGGAMWHGMLRTRGRRLLMAETAGASCCLMCSIDKLAPAGLRRAIGNRAHLVKTETPRQLTRYSDEGISGQSDETFCDGTAVVPAQLPSCTARLARLRAPCSHGSTSRRGYSTSNCGCSLKRYTSPSWRCQ